MKHLTAFLHLIRLPNLLIVALTQYLIYYFVFAQNLHQVGLKTQLNWLEMTGLVITTICIAASGYIINDILDRDIDRINKPHKMIVERIFSVTMAWRMYISTIVLGGLLSIYLAIRTNNLPLLSLYPIAVALLYLYSKYFKKGFLIGNWIVGLFCAFVAGIVWVGESSSLTAIFDTVHQMSHSHYLRDLLLFYLLFAFFATTYREIIKDLEDIDGDRIGGCRTLPIVWGVQRGKVVALANGGILFSITLFFWVYLYEATAGWLPLIPLTGVLLFIAVTLFFSYHAQQATDFHRISQMIKVLMLFGLLLLVGLA
jgi:4-hydroxybenzoate polyprenyltransferase